MDIEKKREQTRERVKRYRNKDVTHSDVTQGVTLLSRPNGADYDPNEKLYNHPFYREGLPRYLGPLSDGQVLDRLTT